MCSSDLAQPLAGGAWWAIAGAVAAAVAALVVSRLVFQAALAKYRSASS